MTEEGSALLIQIQDPSGSWIDVGLLKNRFPNNWFEFIPSYWELSNRPVLGQIFEEHGRRFRPRTHVALPRWFSHLLPEGRLREAVALAAEVNGVREFELLRRLGQSDLPGAVRAIPALTDGLSYEVPPDRLEEPAINEDPLLKFSLAGAQLKYSIFSDERGLTIPAKGTAGNIIAKLPDGRPGFEGVPEAEFGSLELARSSGIETAEASLISVSDIEGLEKWIPWAGNLPILAVSRFDRGPNDHRIHMEELAQIIDIPTAREGAKYKSANFETVADYVAQLTGVGTVATVIDRLVLNVIVGNGDAHLKNWAFQYLDGKTPTISPLYDVLPTVLYVAEDDLGLNLNDSKSFTDVDINSFDALAIRTDFGVSNARLQVRSAVERIMTNWSDLRPYLASSHYQRLTDRLASLPITRLS
ncbi:type II toxin-antitoxin system HipA family toxin [Kribbella sp. NPDC051770]|uniref:type II toxin-antitoxin system HipA family toxin n=1 Tax=Kribbella sp. NPDC051770 TaxID=3155413 RepID=UPI0034160AC5